MQIECTKSPGCAWVVVVIKIHLKSWLKILVIPNRIKADLGPFLSQSAHLGSYINRYLLKVSESERSQGYKESKDLQATVNRMGA